MKEHIRIRSHSKFEKVWVKSSSSFLMMKKSHRNVSILQRNHDILCKVSDFKAI